VVQTDVKRMLAYSSVSHAGFLLVGVEAAAHTAGDLVPGTGVSSVQLYLLFYSVLVIGSFGVVSIVVGDDNASLDRFKGLAKRKPLLAIAFTVFLLAQAGVPFTTGFIAKFGVIQAAVEVDSYAIAIIAMVAAVVAAFLYLRIMVSMWLHDADDDAPKVRVPFAAGVAIGATAIFTVAFGIYPTWFIDWADSITLVR
jgi:NADH-quinone oxidoreductase subunit N